uniref:Multidrug export protein MepA n=1 Tax=Amycolatopsis sp. SANK 60206 TaxID=1642649 RepID=A0A0E3Z896_9PSEU|nr:putative MATE efflux family protein [Amycolatopsis sp. SANK 60206]
MRTADLGTEPIGRLLWGASFQTTMSVATYGIYSLTNAWFVSRGVGPVAFAAVNLASPLLIVLAAVASTVGAGGASLVSRNLGLGDAGGAARAAGNAFLVFWAAAVTVTVVGILALGPMLTLLGATGATRAYAYDYGLIILAGSVTATGFSSLVRAEGRMAFATMLWAVPVAVQILLDPLLIFGFDLGVRGAALGTIGGQSVSAGMSMWFFFVQRNRPYRIRPADLRPHGPTLREIAAIGSPSFLSGLGITLLTALANRLLIDVGGPVALGAFALCNRIGTFVLMPQNGVALALQPITGFNAGRGRPDRVRRALRLSLAATVTYGLVASTLILICATPLIALFTDDPATRAVAHHALLVLAFVYPPTGVALLVSAYFQSLGRPWASYLLVVGAVIAVKIPLLLVFGRIGELGIYLSLPLGELVTAGLALWLLRRSRAQDRPS